VALALATMHQAVSATAAVTFKLFLSKNQPGAMAKIAVCTGATETASRGTGKGTNCCHGGL